MSILIQIISLLIFLFVVVYIGHSWVLHFRMWYNSKKDNPYMNQGSSVIHGMIFKDDERGVYRTQQPSLSEYKRLAEYED